MSLTEPGRPSSVSGEGLFVSRRFFASGALLIAALVLCLYSVSLGHNFLFDEENIILRNPLIRSFTLVPELFRHGYFYFEGRAADWQQYYRPLTSLTFTVDHFFWKFDPFGYNLTNLLLHLTVSILLFRLLALVLRSEWPAFLAAFLWSIHTIHTEAVTYTASRGDLLGAMLALSAMLLYARERKIAALAAYGLALFSKESLLLFPLMIASLEAGVLKRGWRKAVLNAAPFFAAALLFFMFRKLFSPVPLGPPSDEPPGALLRMLSMGRAFTDYLQAVLFPEAFKFCKSISFAGHFAERRVIETAALGVLLAAAWLAALRRRGAVFFGLSIFLIGLIPYSQLIHFYPEWAEHYLYIPSMGLAVLFGKALSRLPLRFPARGAWLLGTIYLLYAGFLGVRTWQRNEFYKDTEKYYRRLAESDSPYAYYGYQNLARIAIERGRWDEAVVPLKTASMIEPSSDITHNLLGLVELHALRMSEAIAHFEEAFRLSGDTKYLANAGTALIRSGAYAESIRMFEAVWRSAPAQLSVYTNLIAACELSGDPGKARAWGEAGLEVFRRSDREAVVLWMALARLAFRQGSSDKLEEALTRILTQCPGAFWYADLAGLWSGKITSGAFLDKVKQEYPGFESAGRMGVLIAHVIRREPEETERFYVSNREILEEHAASHPLIARELAIAKEYAKAAASI